ncbi:Hypothetical_protein [Hexamita inflata]|uniref:Hypothetical_protein n=1 Tax=Hexamita inflata TaxID=28002 RepID=A0AA86QZG9_9EUKA|nr:Hypothetical protein HINF_LOCUS50229 [Hexamita inflata]
MYSINESCNQVIQIREDIFVRIIVSAHVELKQVHKIILLYRPQEKLNIWKIEVLSSQFINKILIMENNNFTQQFQKQKRPSLVVMMLSYTTAPVHNDTEDLDYFRMLQNNISKYVQNIFTTKSERTTLIPFMFDSDVPLHTTLLSQKIRLCQRSLNDNNLQLKFF